MNLIFNKEAHTIPVTNKCWPHFPESSSLSSNYQSGHGFSKLRRFALAVVAVAPQNVSSAPLALGLFRSRPPLTYRVSLGAQHIFPEKSSSARTAVIQPWSKWLNPQERSHGFHVFKLLHHPSLLSIRRPCLKTLVLTCGCQLVFTEHATMAAATI